MQAWIFNLLDEIRLEIMFSKMERDCIMKIIGNQEDVGLGA